MIRMSVIVTLGVISLFCFFLLFNRRSRRRWFENLSLPGEWVEQLGDDKIGGRIRFSGSLENGKFELEDKDGEQEQVGDWEIVRSDLILTPVGGPARRCALRYFKPGVISLSGENEVAVLYHKVGNNVVSLIPAPPK